MTASAVELAGRVLSAAIEERIFPGATVDVGSGTGPLWCASCGALTFDADAPPTTRDTLFDLASLTKPVATTSIFIDLVRLGTIRPDTTVSSLIDEWRGV